MASVNKVILIGNLGHDPESRFLADGTAIANFSLATTEHWKGKDGNKQEKTEWHRIVLWKNLAENAVKYLKKGSAVYIEGSLQTHSWKDKDGIKRYTTEIKGRVMQFLSGKKDEAEATPSNQSSPPQTDDDDLPF